MLRRWARFFGSCLPFVISITLAIVLLRAAIAARPEPATVLLGPEIMISRNEPYAHVETSIAASSERGSLLGGTITLRGDWGVVNEAYSSADGGNSWTPSLFDHVFSVAGDPQVAYDGREALFASNGALRGQDIHRRYGVILFSREGTQNWRYRAWLPIGDRPLLFVGHRSGGATAPIYLAGMGTRNLSHCNAHPKFQAYNYGCIEYFIQIYRSSDGGSHFAGPYMVALSRPGFGINSVNSAQVLHEGQIVYPYVQWSNIGDRTTSHYYLAVANASGTAFSTPRRIGVQHLANRPHLKMIASSLALGADSSAGPFRDRVYAAWSDFTGAGLRIVASYSTNEGKTWSRPEEIAPTACTECLQYIPAVAVARNGDVGVMWLDTRNTRNEYRYDVYFTASVDGGRTYLPARRLTTVSSYALDPGNLTPIPYYGSNHENGILSYSIATAYSRFQAGGDYLGLTADNDSIFHPLWPDSRSIAYQAYTTRVWVGVPSSTTAGFGSRVEDITALVDVMFDPMTYDATKHVYYVPLRIRNVSHETLKPPFFIVTTQDFARVLPNVSIVDADNGLRTNGARFSYTETMRALASLSPGGVTGARVWEFHVTSPDEVLYNIPMRVYGSIAR